MRSESEILVAEEEFFDRIWYGRHAMSANHYEEILAGTATNPKTTPEIAKVALEAAERVRQRRGGEENLLPEDDFEWGMFNGKLSALRWVLGDEWDMLDT